MKLRRLIPTVVAVAAFSAGIASQTLSGHAVFEQALAKERVEGNLPEAIRLYERVVTEFASDRALAAKALVQVGLCYEKLGRDESVRAYERLLRDYADQTDAVSQARARLAALKRPVSGAGVAATMPGPRALPRLDQVNDLQGLSPDGRMAAFIGYDGGQNLAVYDLASQQTKFLTSFDWTRNWTSGAVWSPDSRRVAYTQGGFGPDAIHELRVATLDGKSEVIFRNDVNPGKAVAPAGWLPDGSALVVGLVRADNTAAIGLVPAAGGPFTPIRSGKWTGGADLPSLSPDGRLIAFADGSAGMREIQVVSRDGRAAHRITDHPADDYRPLWSPTGGHLVFLSTRNGSTALWAVAIRDGQSAGEPVRVREGMQDARLLNWTKSGLAYKQPIRTDDIYTMPLDRMSAEPAGSARQLAFRRTGRNIQPAWSPDGKHFAFISGSPAEPDRRSVVVLPNDDGEPREFPIPTSQYSNVQAPYDLRWFGNSAGLGFSGEDAKGQGVLFRLMLATGEWKTFPLQVTTWTRIEWNADGSRYYYARQGLGGGDSAIVEHDLPSGSERMVFKGGTGQVFRALQFSPDRRSLAFRSNTTTRQSVAVVDIETGQSRVLLDEGVGISAETAITHGSPVWSPDGRAILFPRTEKQVTELRLIPVAGGDARRVLLGSEFTRLAAEVGQLRPPITTIAWSPDGSRLAFTLTASRIDTWLLENPLAVAGASASTRR